MSIYSIPFSNIIILKKNNKNSVFVWNKYYHLLLNIPLNWCFLNKDLAIIGIKDEYLDKNTKVILNNILNDYIFKWDFFFFKKLSYKGKSFKLKKNKKFINFTLNTSHLTWTYSNLHILKKIKKNKLLYFYINNTLFNNFIYKILNYRFINIYTKRGLRLTRMKLFKKKGKTNMKV
jgi:hypothetical protein